MAAVQRHTVTHPRSHRTMKHEGLLDKPKGEKWERASDAVNVLVIRQDNFLVWPRSLVSPDENYASTKGFALRLFQLCVLLSCRSAPTCPNEGA